MTSLGNPPIPLGYRLLNQSAITPQIPLGYRFHTQPPTPPAMTEWALMLLGDAARYPMFASASRSFGVLTLVARVEWHAPDFQNHKIHRGITLYESTISAPGGSAVARGVDVCGHQPLV